MENTMDWLRAFLGSGDAALPAVFVVAAVALAAIIYELLAGARRAVIPPSVRAHVFEHLKNGRRREALSQAQDKNSPFTNIVKAALRLPIDAPSYISYASIEDGLFREIAAMRSRVSLIQGLGLLSLLVGFAGALGGLYKNLSAGEIQTAATVSRAVTECLPAATAGLIVAVIVLAFGFLLQMRLASNEAALTGDSSRLAAYLLGQKYIEAMTPGAPAADEEAPKPAESKGDTVAPQQPA